MNEGYLLKFGEDIEIGVTESALPETIDYLNERAKLSKEFYRPVSIVWSEFDESMMNRLNIIDESSFEYEITDTKNEFVMYIPCNIRKNIFSFLNEQGYKLIHCKKCCPVIDRLSGVKLFMIASVREGNDFAHICDVDKLNRLCDKILEIDKTQEGFIHQIKDKAKINKITQEQCDKLINLLNELISTYEVNYE